jgi:hypothetical protein
MDRSAIGELSYERQRPPLQSTLLQKRLLTSQPLSILLNPDDAYARWIGISRPIRRAHSLAEAHSGAEM